jgi:hypothetical protein
MSDKSYYFFLPVATNTTILPIPGGVSVYIYFSFTSSYEFIRSVTLSALEPYYLYSARDCEYI